MDRRMGDNGPCPFRCATADGEYTFFPATSAYPLGSPVPDNVRCLMSASLFASSGGAFFGFIVYLAIIVLEIAGWWMIFSKAGRPGWGAIIPIYNVYLMCKVAGRPGWWLLLFLIPIVNIVIAIIVGIDIAKNFAKSAGYGVGLALLGFIFAPMLGFGDAAYTQPAEYN
jgi:Family of unknown function (DUF5684)